ncbi:hypothetical protein QTP88_028807 [Uroleucon formosanum]
MNRKTSVIWDYFTVIESDKAKCGFYKTVLKFNQSSTTNLLRHIKSKHPTTDLSKRSRPNFDVEENNPDDPSSNNGNLSASTSSNSGVVSTSTSNRDRSPLLRRQPSSSICPQQCQISNYFSKPITASKRQLIDQQTCYMLAHSLNLIVQSSLDQIKETRVKVKSIVEYFKRSTLATEKLNQMQEQLGYSPVHTLIQDVVTRWNSTFHMFQRFFELKSPILSSLADLNYDVSLTSDDWQIISKSCNILKQFEEITFEMSSEKGVTISKTILFTQALINFCNKLMTQHQTIPCIDSFIHKLTEETNKIFGQLEKDML